MLATWFPMTLVCRRAQRCYNHNVWDEVVNGIFYFILFFCYQVFCGSVGYFGSSIL